MDILLKKYPVFQWNIKNIGLAPNMDGYEKRRLGIFNRINFFGFLTGLIIPLAGMFSSGYLPLFAWFVACSPAFISGVVLISNYYRKYNFAMMWYFAMYSIITALLYAGGVDAGVELFFILYGVLAVFFLQEIKKISIAVSISVICYSIVFVLHGKYAYVMKDINQGFYVFNHLLSVLFIFMGLFLIKKENAAYQQEMKSANDELHAINLEIFQQRKELADKANQLEQQTKQLAELDGLKNKLFSIIAHDLKTPIYGLQNLFKNVAQHDLSGNEIKILVPDIMNNLNYTTGLMENLLQWAKSQMQGDSINQQLLEVGDMVDEVLKLLTLQADAKQVYIDAKVEPGIYIFADKDMMELVLRNLISNAIKFTPNNGHISVTASVSKGNVQVKIADTGMGMSNENMQQLFGKNYYSTRGSNNESGTGLGLKLCKEFINKNEGHIYVESELGKGSTFSFVLPKA